MRLAVPLLVCLSTAWLAAGEPLKVELKRPANYAATSGVQVVGSTVEVAAFDVTSTGLPAWLGRSLQHSVREELSQLDGISVVNTEAATQPTTQASADYLIRGRCSGAPDMMDVTVDVLHAASQTVIQSVRVSGHPTDLLQIKAALRSEVRRLFAPVEGPVPIQHAEQEPPKAEIADAEPDAETAPGSQYEGSALEWALSNPEQFQRHVENDQRSYHMRPHARFRSTGQPRGFVTPRTPYIWPETGTRVEGHYSDGHLDLHLTN